MNKAVLAIAATLALATGAQAALKPPAKAPAFSATAYQNGQARPYSLSAALKQGPVVLYFFPAAYTGGCNAEAKAFADAIGEFSKAGASVIGVTSGNTERLADFSKEYCNGKFPVAAATPATLKAYDAQMAMGMTSRTSYVIGRDGKVAFAYSALNPDQHISKTLAAVRALKR